MYTFQESNIKLLNVVFTNKLGLLFCIKYLTTHWKGVVVQCISVITNDTKTYNVFYLFITSPFLVYTGYMYTRILTQTTAVSIRALTSIFCLCYVLYSTTLVGRVFQIVIYETFKESLHNINVSRGVITFPV